MKTDSINGFAIVAIALMLVVSYVGSYFVLVEAKPLAMMTGRGPWPRVAHYRIGGRFSETVFTPIHWLDRRVRVRTWQFTDEDLFENILGDPHSP